MKKKCILKKNFLEILRGCSCWSPGEILDSFGHSHLSLGFQLVSWKQGSVIGRAASGAQPGSAFPNELGAVGLFPVLSPRSSFLQPQPSFSAGSLSCNCTWAQRPCCHLPSPLISLLTSHSQPPSERRSLLFCHQPLSEGLCPLPRQMAAWPIFNCL